MRGAHDETGAVELAARHAETRGHQWLAVAGGVLRRQLSLQPPQAPFAAQTGRSRCRRGSIVHWDSAAGTAAGPALAGLMGLMDG